MKTPHSCEEGRQAPDYRRVCHLLRRMEEGSLRRLLFAPTGALLSPTSSFQGESIPGICHAVLIENQTARKDG